MKCSMRSEELLSLGGDDDRVMMGATGGAGSGDPWRHSAKLSLTVFMTRLSSSSDSLQRNQDKKAISKYASQFVERIVPKHLL